MNQVIRSQVFNYESMLVTRTGTIGQWYTNLSSYLHELEAV